MARIIEISYSSINGSASKNWLMTSGGVKIAAITNEKSMQYFLFEVNHLTSIIPILTRSSIKIGNWKQIPKARISLITRDKYSEILGSTSIGNPEPLEGSSNDRKKFHAIGITT